MTTDNIILIGDKPFMKYIASIVMKFTADDEKEVIVKGRGKNIIKAIDVAEVLTKTFLQEINILKIKTDSNEFEKNGNVIRVSTIEIVLG